MKEETFLHKNNTSDEILNNLLKTNFDSNIKDESLDIDMSACVTITSVHSCSGLSQDFWKTLDENAQSSGALLGSNSLDETSTSGSDPDPIKFTFPEPIAPPDATQTMLGKLKKNLLIPQLKLIKDEPLDTEPESVIPNPTPSSKVDTDVLESAGIRFKYKCEQCDVLLNGLSEFMLHDSSHKFLLKCEECSREFENESGFKKHAKMHRNGVRKDVWQECPDCGKSLKLGSMWMHRKIHTDSKKYGCEVCGQKFVQKINLTNHAKVHSGEKPFECSQCQKSFPEKSHLLRHQKYHTSTRPFKCEKCGKMYKTERCLKVHNLVHLEQRPFVCHVCNKSFISNSKLKQHSNIHTGERPYKCNYCTRDFTNFPNWLKHTRRRHKVDHKTGEILENIPSYGSKPKTAATTKIEVTPVTEEPKPTTVTKRRKKTKVQKTKETEDSPPNAKPSDSVIIPKPAPAEVIEIKVEKREFNDIHCLSLNSAEELIMEQALEMEESGLLHSNNDVHIKFEDFDPTRPLISSLDSSPFSSPASAELPPFTLAIPSIKTVISSPFPFPTASPMVSAPSNVINTNNFYFALPLTSNQKFTAVDFSNFPASFFQGTNK